MLIDDTGRDDLVSPLGTRWQALSDRVMGGISEPALDFEVFQAVRCLHLHGDVRLENDGGFIQMALDLNPDGGSVDLRSYAGIRLRVLGNGEHYGIHLRTEDIRRPWQSYRAQFEAPPRWLDIELPFTAFTPHRIDTPLDLSHVRRLGVVAIGRAFECDLRVAKLELYR